MRLSEKIMDLRKKSGWSQEELADRLGISRQSVSKWETDTAIPDLDKLIKICDIFNISLDELTGRESTQETQSPQTIIVEKSSSLTVSKILGCILMPFLCIVAKQFFFVSYSYLPFIFLSNPR